MLAILIGLLPPVCRGPMPSCFEECMPMFDVGTASDMDRIASWHLPRYCSQLRLADAPLKKETGSRLEMGWLPSDGFSACEPQTPWIPS